MNDYYYKIHYKRAWRYLTEFYWWSITDGRTYDIFHGDFKRAWNEYMKSDDPFAEHARKEYENNELAQRAFNDYVSKYIQEVRNAEKEREHISDDGGN